MALICSLSGCGSSSDNATPAPVVQGPPPQPDLPPVPAALPPVPPAPPPPQTPQSVLLQNRVNVALLLPLTGANAALGADMLDAAQSALSELGSNDLALTPKDTGGTPDGAARAAMQAISEGAKLIIGPLTAPEIDAVKPVAQQANINLIAFSNVAGVAGNGAFLIGFLPEQEIDRVTGYAISMGTSHFAAIAPADAYGQLALGAFQNAIGKQGGSLDATELFSPDESNLEATVQHLANGGAITWNAVLLPEGGQQLKDVALQLAGQKIAPPEVRLLGTGLWDVPGLGNEPSLVGAWYAAPPAEARAGFEQRFTQIYGHAPQRLASLAYDAVGVAAVLDRAKQGNFSTDALTNPSGFAGTNGIFRFLPDGTNERGLAVLEVEANGTSIVSPAPQSFAGPTQ